MCRDDLGHVALGILHVLYEVMLRRLESVRISLYHHARPEVRAGKHHAGMP